jgi:hypothetical protein
VPARDALRSGALRRSAADPANVSTLAAIAVHLRAALVLDTDTRGPRDVTANTIAETGGGDDL